jgi:hypothetical protein
MSYKDTFRPKEVTDPNFLADLKHQLKTQFFLLEKSRAISTSSVVIRSGGSVTVTATPDRHRIPKVDGIPVSASGTTISFLTDCSPAEAYPHNSYLILAPQCWRMEGSDKVDISVEFSDLTSTSFKATPAEDGYLKFETVLI